jgi:hypothetical protein
MGTLIEVIESSQMRPCDRDEYAKYDSKYFTARDHFDGLNDRSISIGHDGSVYLWNSDRTRAFRAGENIREYLTQETGMAAVMQVGQRTRIAQLQQQPPTLLHRLFGKTPFRHAAATSDVIGIPRNALGASAARAAQVGATALGAVAGPLVVGLAAPPIVASGATQLYAAAHRQDFLAGASGGATLAGGLAYGGFGIALTTKTVALATAGGLTHSLSPAATPVVAKVAAATLLPLAVGIYGAFLIKGLIDLYTTGLFRSQFHAAEQKGPEAAIRFLHEQVTLTFAEFTQLRARQLSPERLEQEVKRLLLRKYERFANNTSPELLQKVLSDEFLALVRTLNLEDQGPRTLLINDAKSLFNEIDCANYKKVLKSAFVTTLSILGLTSVIVAWTCPGANVATAVLFAVVALLWLAADFDVLFDQIAQHLYQQESLRRRDSSRTLIQALPSLYYPHLNPLLQLETDIRRVSSLRIGKKSWKQLHSADPTLPTFREALQNELNGGRLISPALFKQIATCCQQGTSASGTELVAESCRQSGLGWVLGGNPGGCQVAVERQGLSWVIRQSANLTIRNQNLDTIIRSVRIHTITTLTPTEPDGTDPLPRVVLSVEKL